MELVHVAGGGLGFAWNHPRVQNRVREQSGSRTRLTCDVGQPEALPRQTVVRVEVDPHVVLGGQVGGWERRPTHPQPVQAPVAADGDPVGGAAVGTLQVKVLEAAEEEESLAHTQAGPGPGTGPGAPRTSPYLMVTVSPG